MAGPYFPLTGDSPRGPSWPALSNVPVAGGPYGPQPYSESVAPSPVPPSAVSPLPPAQQETGWDEALTGAFPGASPLAGDPFDSQFIRSVARASADRKLQEAERAENRRIEALASAAAVRDARVSAALDKWRAGRSLGSGSLMGEGQTEYDSILGVGAFRSWLEGQEQERQLASQERFASGFEPQEAPRSTTDVSLPTGTPPGTPAIGAPTEPAGPGYVPGAAAAELSRMAYEEAAPREAAAADRQALEAINRALPRAQRVSPDLAGTLAAGGTPSAGQRVSAGVSETLRAALPVSNIAKALGFNPLTGKSEDERILEGYRGARERTALEAAASEGDIGAKDELRRRESVSGMASEMVGAFRDDPAATAMEIVSGLVDYAPLTATGAAALGGLMTNVARSMSRAKNATEAARVSEMARRRLMAPSFRSKLGRAAEAAAYENFVDTGIEYLEDKAKGAQTTSFANRFAYNALEEGTLRPGTVAKGAQELRRSDPRLLSRQDMGRLEESIRGETPDRTGLLDLALQPQAENIAAAWRGASKVREQVPQLETSLAPREDAALGMTEPETGSMGFYGGSDASTAAHELVHSRSTAPGAEATALGELRRWGQGVASKASREGYVGPEVANADEAMVRALLDYEQVSQPGQALPWRPPERLLRAAKAALGSDYQLVLDSAPRLPESQRATLMEQETAAEAPAPPRQLEQVSRPRVPPPDGTGKRFPILRGQEVRDMKGMVARLASPTTEVSHYVILGRVPGKDGEVVLAHNAVSNKRADMVSTESFGRLVDRAERLRAQGNEITRVVHVHNHPDGNNTPSEADRRNASSRSRMWSQAFSGKGAGYEAWVAGSDTATRLEDGGGKGTSFKYRKGADSFSEISDDKRLYLSPKVMDGMARVRRPKMRPGVVEVFTRVGSGLEAGSFELSRKELENAMAESKAAMDAGTDPGAGPAVKQVFGTIANAMGSQGASVVQAIPSDAATQEVVERFEQMARNGLLGQQGHVFFDIAPQEGSVRPKWLTDLWADEGFAVQDAAPLKATGRPVRLFQKGEPDATVPDKVATASRSGWDGLLRGQVDSAWPLYRLVRSLRKEYGDLVEMPGEKGATVYDRMETRNTRLAHLETLRREAVDRLLEGYSRLPATEKALSSKEEGLGKIDELLNAETAIKTIDFANRQKETADDLRLQSSRVMEYVRQNRARTRALAREEVALRIRAAVAKEALSAASPEGAKSQKRAGAKGRATEARRLVRQHLAAHDADIRQVGRVKARLEALERGKDKPGRKAIPEGYFEALRERIAMLDNELAALAQERAAGEEMLKRAEEMARPLTAEERRLIKEQGRAQRASVVSQAVAEELKALRSEIAAAKATGKMLDKVLSQALSDAKSARSSAAARSLMLEEYGGRSREQHQAVVDEFRGRSEEHAKFHDRLLGFIAQRNEEKNRSRVELGLITQEQADRMVAAYGETWVPQTGVDPLRDESMGVSGRAAFDPMFRSRARSGRTTAAQGTFVKWLDDASRSDAALDDARTALELKRLATELTSTDISYIPEQPSGPETALYDHLKVPGGGVLRFPKPRDGEKSIGSDLGELFTTKKSNSIQGNILVQTLDAVNDLLRKSYTTWSPDFISGNPARDISQAALYLFADGGVPSLARFGTAYPNALRKAVTDEFGGRKDDRFGRAGGRMEFSERGSLEDERKRIAKTIERMGARDPQAVASAVGGAYFRMLATLSGVFETATRRAVFDTQKRAGYGDTRAARDALSATAHFGRKGSSDIASLLNKGYLFYNAALQGNYGLVQKMLESPATARRSAGAVAGYVLAKALADFVALGEKDEDTGEALWSHAAAHSINTGLPVAYDKASRTFTVLPTAYPLAPLNALGHAIAKAMAGMPVNKTEAAKEFFGSLSDSFMPMTGGTAAQFIAPTVLDPVVQAVEGRDFAGRGIYRDESLRRFDKDAQIRPSRNYYEYKVDPLFRKLAAVLNGLGSKEGEEFVTSYSRMLEVNPATMQILAQGYFGGPLKTAMNAYSLVSGQAAADERKGGVSARKRIPAVGRYMVSVPRDLTLKALDNKDQSLLRDAKKFVSETSSMVKLLRDATVQAQSTGDYSTAVKLEQAINELRWLPEFEGAYVLVTAFEKYRGLQYRMDPEDPDFQADVDQARKELRQIIDRTRGALEKNPLPQDMEGILSRMRVK